MNGNTQADGLAAVRVHVNELDYLVPSIQWMVAELAMRFGDDAAEHYMVALECMVDRAGRTCEELKSVVFVRG